MRRIWLHLGLIAAASALLLAQSTVLTNTTVLTGTTKMGAVNLTHSVTLDYGGTAALNASNLGGVDSGNASFPILSPFQTPASSCTVSSVNQYIASAQTGQTWGSAIYGTQTFVLTQVEANTPSAGEATYLGTITGGGSNAFANFTFYISGFTNAGNNSLANGATLAVISSTAGQLVVTNANAVNETNPGQALAVGSLVCGTSSTSNPSNGWNNLTPSSCGTLSPSTIYEVASYTNNNTQGQGTANVSGACVDGNPSFAGLGLGTAFTNSTVSSISPWPSTLPAYGIGTIYGGTSNASPCHASYVALSCTSQNHYDILQTSVGNCDQNASSGCQVNIPATQGGNESLLVGCIADLSSATCTGASDSASDTFTQVGSCPGVSGTGAICFYLVPRVPAGVTSVSVTFSGGAVSSKSSLVVLEIAGTQSSPLDKNCYDSAYENSTVNYNSGTGACSTSTTSVATELVIGIAWDNITGGSLTVPEYLAPSGSWSTLYFGGTAGNSSHPIGVYYQVASAKAAYSMSLIANPSISGTHAIYGAIVTLE